MARRETPLARATSDIPPRPWAALSAAAHNRRERSSSHASNREKRCLISPSLATRTFQAKNGLIATLIFLQSLSRSIPPGSVHCTSPIWLIGLFFFDLTSPIRLYRAFFWLDMEPNTCDQIKKGYAMDVRAKTGDSLNVR
jgi:hypothetical protein